MNGLFLKNRLNHGFRGLMDFTEYFFTVYLIRGLLELNDYIDSINPGISEEERDIEVT